MENRRRPPPRRLFALGILLLPLVLCGALTPLAVASRRGMVVAAAPEAAQAGAEILAAGGNATDAAVATAFALAVVWPAAGNLGGGGFWISRDPRGRVRSIDFRETAPRAADRDMFVREAAAGRPDASLIGMLASGVPGSVAGLWLAHRRGGRLPWRRCLAPAAGLARNGFPVSASLRDSIAAESRRLEKLPAAAAIFLPGGAPPPVGMILRQPELAATLAAVARHGAAGFYRGPVAEKLLAWQRAGGGLITADDLRAYRPREAAPVQFSFNGYRIYTAPPPSAGVILGEMARMAELSGLDQLQDDSPVTLHRLIEIERRAFLDRNRRLGDSAFVRIPLRELLDPGYLRAKLATIDPQRASPTSALAPSAAPPDSPHTTHFSVVDRFGGAVAVTTTLNDNFGSGEMVPGGGFLMNNEMDDFTARPGEPNFYGLIQGAANAIAPGKRPLSSMSPAIAVRRGRVRLVWGTPGGSTILTTNFQMLWRVLARGQSLAEAQAAPRIHQQDFPDAFDWEPEVPTATRDALAAMGHRPGHEWRLGRVDAIEILADGTRIGVSDPRAGGAAVAEPAR